jgi:hypothetical protein
MAFGNSSGKPSRNAIAPAKKPDVKTGNDRAFRR